MTKKRGGAGRLARLERREFFDRLASRGGAGEKCQAVFLFVPPEWLPVGSAEPASIDGIVAYGRLALEQLHCYGMYTRNGHASYMAVAETSREELSRWIAQTTAWWQNEPEARIWRLAFAADSSEGAKLLDIFSGLEWKALEAARDQESKLVFEI